MRRNSVDWTALLGKDLRQRIRALRLCRFCPSTPRLRGAFVPVVTLMAPHVLYEDEEAVIWATLVRAGRSLVFDVHAVVTATTRRRLLAPAGAVLFDRLFHADEGPSLSWALRADGHVQPLPTGRGGGGTELHAEWTWVAECRMPGDAVQVHVVVPAVGAELDRTVPWA